MKTRLYKILSICLIFFLMVSIKNLHAKTIIKYAAILTDEVFELSYTSSNNYELLFDEEIVELANETTYEENVLIQFKMLKSGKTMINFINFENNEISSHNITILENANHFKIINYTPNALDGELSEFGIQIDDFDQILSKVDWTVNGEKQSSTENSITFLTSKNSNVIATVSSVSKTYSTNILIRLGLEKVFLIIIIPILLILIFFIMRYLLQKNSYQSILRRYLRFETKLNDLYHVKNRNIKWKQRFRLLIVSLEDINRLLYTSSNQDKKLVDEIKKDFKNTIKILDNMYLSIPMIDQNFQNKLIKYVIRNQAEVKNKIDILIKNDTKENVKDIIKHEVMSYKNNISNKTKNLDNVQQIALNYLNSLDLEE